MFILHCTKKARDRLKVKPSTDLPDSTTTLGNWYCNVFFASRKKYILFTNERSLLSIIIESRGLKTKEDVVELFCKRLGDMLRRLGIPYEKVMPEYLEMKDVVYAKTQNQRVLGSMTDIVHCTKSDVQYNGDLGDSLEVFKSINFMALSMIGMRRPSDVVGELFNEEIIMFPSFD